MSALLGIDLGTSSVKVVVFAMDGSIRGIGSAEYPILTPSVGGRSNYNLLENLCFICAHLWLKQSEPLQAYRAGGCQLQPSALMRFTAAVRRAPCNWTALLSWVSAVVWAVATLR